MKIVVVGTRGFPGIPGGVEQHCEQLYPRLVSRGCEVVAATRAPYLPPEKRLEEWRGVRFLHLPAVRSKHFEAAFHTWRGVLAARRLRPDLLHFHAIGPSLFVPLARVLGLKTVMTDHGPDYQRGKWGRGAQAMLRLGESCGVRFSSRVIAISKGIAADIAERYGRPDVAYIPNGVAIPEPIPAGETLRKFGLRPRGYLFTACRFVPEKGLEALVAAFGRMPGANLKLAIAGAAQFDDPTGRAVQSAACADPRIVLTGFISGRPLAELFSNAGLFVLPSLYEGLPIALLEALSYGLPVAVSDIPQHREVPLPSFRYFPPSRPEAMAEKIAECLKRGISAEERKSTLALLRRDFDWDAIADRTLAVYRSVLG
jgi:glycosyltransferase involved in cell wall biosynthesis